MLKQPEADYIVYTDGGCAVNPAGPGGIGVVIIDTDTGEITEISKGYNCTTNNRMEILAVITAMEFVKKGTVSLYSDSEYVLNTLSGKFQKKKNHDLWERLDEASKEIHFQLESSIQKKIELLEKYELEQIHIMPTKEYAEKYHTSESCAKKICEFNK